MLEITEISCVLLLPFSFIIIFTIFLIIFIYKWHSSSILTAIYKSSSPPSPPKLPIIGNLHQLGLHPHRSLQALARRHGPLMLLHFGSVPVLIVSSTELAEQIMKTHDIAFSERPKLTAFDKLLYNFKDVAMAPYGEYWRQMKSISVLHLLSNKRVQSFRAVREEETKSMVEKIEECCSPSSSVNLSEVSMKLTNDVVCRVALGRKYSDVEDGKKFEKLLGDLVELFGSFVVGDYIPLFSWLSFVNGFDGKLKKVAKEFDEFLEKVVQEHVDDHNNREIEKYKDFTDILLHAQNENPLIDRVCIKAIILDMFAGGTETTSIVLEWAMTELLRHPSIMHKLQAEIRSIAGSITHITEDHLEGMVYLKAVIKETIRLHPPLPLIPRVSRTQVEINGYEIQPGSHVYISAWAIGRDPISWERPEEFNPDRFLVSDVDYKGHDFRLIPFGSGRRGCPGIQFAVAVTEIALANLVHRFDWGLPGGERGEDLDISEATGLGIHKKFPLIAVPALYDISANN